MNYLTSLLKELVAKRKLIWELSKADFRKRFVGSYFGVVWMFIQPIVTVLIYWLIFGPIGFKSAPPVPNASYVQWLVPGIAPWFFFSEALNCGTGCLQEYNYLVKKVVFKVEILPVIKLISCLFVHAFFVASCLSYSWSAAKDRRFPGSRSFIIPLPHPCTLWRSRTLRVRFRYSLRICTDRQHLPAVRHVADPIMYSEQLFLDKGLTMLRMI